MTKEGQEAREISGVTTSLILAYVEREGGAEAVGRVLERAGLAGREGELRDEDRWFADQRRVDLFHAAEQVLDDPDVARHAGEAAIDLSTGQALKLALRSLGSPRLVYANIARANARFNTVHSMTLLDESEGRATLRNVPAEHIAYDPCDCGYNVGLLSCVPLIFGLPAATVSHPVCIGRGASECLFEVEWRERPSPVGWFVLAVAALAAGVVFQPLLPLTALVAALAMALAVRRMLRTRRVDIGGLRARVREQAEAAERMMTSLKDLVSALQLDEVLTKITDNAQAAVSGAEFALLVREGERLRCRSSSRLPAGHLETIERWAEQAELPLDGSLTIDDLRSDRGLESLVEDTAHPIGALCAAPLVSRGESMGVLIALTIGVKGFLPRDVVQLESYAAQAAIALTNARLYEAQQTLATEDPLTGLFNHRRFHETLESELDRCRGFGTEVGVAIFDLDGFKLINDRDGHADGDRVLRRVAAAMASGCRRSDSAFRVGGDEFALVLPATGAEAAREVALRAARAIEQADGRVSVSWGVAAWPDGGLGKEALLASADQSMYEMKQKRWQSVGRPELRVSEVNPIQDSRKAERLVCASRLAVRLAPMLDLQEICETVVAELLRSFPLNVATVCEIEESTLRARAIGGQMGEQVDLEGWQQSLEAGISGRAARIGEPVIVADTRSDPGYLGTGASQESCSELATPIRVGGRLWGVLNLEHRHTNAFEHEDLLFAETVAAACGAAIHRTQLYGELESAFTRTLAVLSDALEAKDAYTAVHAREVSDLAEHVADRLGISGESIREVTYAALLHDIGKIGVRGEILRKPGPLTPSEYEEMKEHTVLGARMLERIPFFANVHPMVRSSHERWDGRGYPDRLAGEEIPLGARIIGACDTFNAMTSDRPYRRAMSVADARAEIESCAGSQFDPAVAAILLELTAGDQLPAGDGGERESVRTGA